MSASAARYRRAALSGSEAWISPGAVGAYRRNVDTLGDDLVLLSLNPGSGRVSTVRKIGYGLMGSELVRLAAGGRVDIEAGRIVVRSALPTGDAELDAALASIVNARRPPRAERWVGRPRHGICNAYLERLAAAGSIRKESAVLTRWRITRPQLVAGARARLDAVAVSTAPLDLSQAAFGGLAHAIGLDALLYSGWGNRGIRKRFEQIAKGQWMAPATRRTSHSPADLAVDRVGDVLVADDPGDSADHAAHHPATHAPSHAPAHAATQAAAHAATQAAAHAATQAAVNAATHAAVHAATQAAVHASVSAAHSGAVGGGGHGGH
jgi:hypothetical protein